MLETGVPMRQCNRCAKFCGDIKYLCMRRISKKFKVCIIEDLFMVSDFYRKKKTFKKYFYL